MCVGQQADALGGDVIGATHHHRLDEDGRGAGLKRKRTGTHLQSPQPDGCDPKQGCGPDGGKCSLVLRVSLAATREERRGEGRASDSSTCHGGNDADIRQ